MGLPCPSGGTVTPCRVGEGNYTDPVDPVRRVTSATPASTSAAPTSWIGCTGSASSHAPSAIVNTGPSEPTSDVAFAPMRRIASATSQVGTTVEAIAIVSDSAWTDGGTSSAASGLASAKCTNTNTVDVNIASAFCYAVYLVVAGGVIGWPRNAADSSSTIVGYRNTTRRSSDALT